MPFKTIEIRGHPVFNNVYDGLPNENALKITIKDIIAEMKKDINKGDYMKRKPYPDRYRKLGVHSLFVFDIGNTRRLIYTIRTTKDTKTYQYLDLLLIKNTTLSLGIAQAKAA